MTYLKSLCPSLALGFISVFLGLVSSLSAQIPDGITFTAMFGTDDKNQFHHPALMLEIPGKPGSFLVPEMATGKIWTLVPGNNSYSKTLFGTIAVTSGEDDMGLMGFAFHPNYVNNRKYYVKYGNAQRPLRQLCVEERIAASDFIHDSGTPARRLLTIDQPGEFKDHNGGSPVFGPDGYLYINIGDGGWDLNSPDIHKNGQNLELLHSKILRINVDSMDAGLQYAIPNDNPFVNDPNSKVRRETWAYGLRNPYRISFDRVTGELYVGDVGMDKFDEVNIIKKGGNYGWSLKEHTFCLTAGTCDGVSIESPMAFLPNGIGPGKAKCIIGGVVYRGNESSPFYGVYLFGDYTLKKIFALKKPASGFATVKEYSFQAPQDPIAFTLDSQNNVYMVGFGGTIYKLEHAELKAQATTSVSSTFKNSSTQGSRTMLVLSSQSNGLRLPKSLNGAFEVLTPRGVRLGLINARNGNSQGTLNWNITPANGNGIVILRPLLKP